MRKAMTGGVGYLGLCVLLFGCDRVALDGKPQALGGVEGGTMKTRRVGTTVFDFGDFKAGSDEVPGETPDTGTDGTPDAGTGETPDAGTVYTPPDAGPPTDNDAGPSGDSCVCDPAKVGVPDLSALRGECKSEVAVKIEYDTCHVSEDGMRCVVESGSSTEKWACRVEGEIDKVCDQDLQPSVEQCGKTRIDLGHQRLTEDGKTECAGKTWDTELPDDDPSTPFDERSLEKGSRNLDCFEIKVRHNVTEELGTFNCATVDPQSPFPAGQEPRVTTYADHCGDCNVKDPDDLCDLYTCGVRVECFNGTTQTHEEVMNNPDVSCTRK